MADNKLTPKQQRFVEEYLLDLNATQACIRAGYSQKMAGKIGPQLLGKTRISNAIAEAVEERSRRTQIKQDQVLVEWARIAFSDLRLIFDESNKLKDVRDWPEDVARSISSVEVVENAENGTAFSYTKKIKLWDKNRALENVAKHLGMFEAKIKVSGEIKSGVLIAPAVYESADEWESAQDQSDD